MKVFIILGLSAATAFTAVFFSFLQIGKDTIFEEIEDNCITKAIQKGSSLVDYAARYEMNRKIQGSGIATPTLLLAFSKFPEQESQDISQAAERMEMSIQVLKQKVCQKHKRSLHQTEMNFKMSVWCLEGSKVQKY
ncbi:thyroid peroxidase-like [Pipra filicauda]|uniref:Thyroid peroxidase-like n=1 Tax=Pipra filicauda TaxID=649802 RepID=A0A7R5KJ10_9PASS|nr:thyroid peroxidase-like [Pipra filicauda]